MRRTAWATLAMSLSFLLGMIIAAGALASLGGKLDTASPTAAPLSLPAVLVTCLDPPAILLEIAAIVLIVIDSKKVGNPHRRLAWVAAIFFVIWGALNLGVFLPLSLVGSQRGSLELVRTGQMVKAGAALLQYAIPFLLVYGLSRKAPRVLLWSALALAGQLSRSAGRRQSSSRGIFPSRACASSAPLRTASTPRSSSRRSAMRQRT